MLPFGLIRRGSTENFSRKDRLYSTLPAGSVGRGVRSVTNLARNEESNDWSDDDAVALNGDWVSHVNYLPRSPFRLHLTKSIQGTPEAPRRSETTHAHR